MKAFIKWVGNALLILLIVCAIMAAFSFIKSRKNPNTVPSIGPYKFMSVLSGSMSPTFNTYDMIVDKKVSSENLKKGDVITFWQDSKTLVTHRIVDVQNQDGKVAYKTKGDANNVEDERLIYAAQVEGVYLFRIPCGGLVLSKLRGPIGFVIAWLLFMYVILSEFVFKKKHSNFVEEAKKSENTDINESLNI